MAMGWVSHAKCAAVQCKPAWRMFMIPSVLHLSHLGVCETGSLHTHRAGSQLAGQLTSRTAVCCGALWDVIIHMVAVLWHVIWPLLIIAGGAIQQFGAWTGNDEEDPVAGSSTGALEDIIRVSGMPLAMIGQSMLLLGLFGFKLFVSKDCEDGDCSGGN